MHMERDQFALATANPDYNKQRVACFKKNRSKS